MSEWFWRKLNFFAGWTAVLVLFLSILLAANVEIKDLDLWLHLASGRYILEHHHIPPEDIFSCALGYKPWVNHEWLFQTVIYFFYRLAGFDGLIGLQAVVVASTFAFFLMIGYSRKQQFVPVLLLFLVLLVYQFRFTLRPEMFSLLFFAAYLYILAFYFPGRGGLWILFLIQVLWSNMHGFFILGPAVVAVNICGEWIKRHIPLPFEWNQAGRLNPEEYSRLREIFFAVLLACLLNPYFIQGAWYPLGVFFSMAGENKIFFEHIQELQGPFSWETLFSLRHYAWLKALAALSFVSFLWNWRRMDMGVLLFWGLFFFLAVHAVRNMAFFAFAAYFISIVNFYSVPFERGGRFLSVCREAVGRGSYKHAGGVALKALLIIWMIQFIHQNSSRAYYDFDRKGWKSEFGGVSLQNYPDKAVDFLVKNKIAGNFFNDFNSGAYLIGRTSPRIKVFIDGRTEVYGAAFFSQYDKIWKGDRRLFDEAVRDYHLTGAFLGSVRVPAPAELISRLYADRDWVMVYFDYDAAIFLRDIPQNREWIDSHRVDLSRWQTEKTELLRLGLNKIEPYRYVNRAYALFNMKLYERAIQEAEEGMRIDPSNARLYMLWGKFNIEDKDYIRAFENLRKANLLDPGDIWIRYYLAVSLYHLDEIRGAKDQCQFVLKRRPGHAKALFLLALIHARDQDYPLSREILEKGYRVSPHSVEELIAIADLLSDQGQYARAREVYALALDADPGNTHIKKALEASYQRKMRRLIP
jgi:tetratricopeptide (TPR) repeat protein